MRHAPSTTPLCVLSHHCAGLEIFELVGQKQTREFLKAWGFSVALDQAVDLSRIINIVLQARTAK